MYTGFKTYEVNDELVEDLHNDGKVLAGWDKRCAFYPNMYIELRSNQSEKHTALGKVDATGTRINKISSLKICGVEPRNREQVYALDALNNDDIPVVVLTGSAGTGKTLLSLAVAINKIETRKYKKVILTRPMSEVGRYRLGALPGTMEEKFGPYLSNYMTNLEQLVGDKRAIYDLQEQMKFEIMPIQLFRGASFNNCLVLADEVQVLNYMEMLTIGTRIGENSKIIIMGDLNQRDAPIAKDKTGIYKMVNDMKSKESPLVAAIELQKCERSPTSRLFAEIFEE